MTGGLKGAGWGMPLPFTMGYDLAGVVEEVGNEVKSFSKGDNVFAVQWGKGKHDEENLPCGGSFAQYVLVPASRLSKIPEGVSHSVAAGSALVGTTAYQMLDAAKIGEGSHILVLGGSSAVGHVVIQLAKVRGAKVSTTCSSRTLDFVKQFNPDEVINYTQEKWEEKVSGLDAVLDTVGEKDGFARSKGIVKDGGSFVTIASFDAGFDPSAHPPFSFASFLCLSNDSAVQDKLASLIVEKKLTISLDKEFEFTSEGVHEMLKYLHAGKSCGKNILKIGE